MYKSKVKFFREVNNLDKLEKEVNDFLACHDGIEGIQHSSNPITTSVDRTGAPRSIGYVDTVMVGYLEFESDMNEEPPSLYGIEGEY